MKFRNKGLVALSSVLLLLSTALAKAIPQVDAFETPSLTASENLASPTGTNEAEFGTSVGRCSNSGVPKDVTINFNGLGPYCFRVCNSFDKYLLNSPRGAGYGLPYETSQPLLFPNPSGWYVMNCTAFEGKPEFQACNASDNLVYRNKALYSPGYSPFDSDTPPRLGTVDFPEDYLVFDLKSFAFTPLIDVPDTSVAKVTVRGLNSNGVVATKTFNNIPNNNRSIIEFDGEWKKLTALDIWVTQPRQSKKYPFALDDMAITEYSRPPRPASCNAVPSPVRGPCKPKPTATKTWSANFDEFPLKTTLPIDYKDVEWHGDFLDVLNKSTSQYDAGVIRIGPGEVNPPSPKNFFFPGIDFTILSNEFEKRFGVKEFSVLCSFPGWRNPDYSETNGAPCKVQITGRRDFHDGSGLPTLVQATVEIPNPGNDTSDRPFTRIQLDNLTDQKGGFSRLSRFYVRTTIGISSTNAGYDNFVFTRELGEGEKCRVGGVTTVNFDDLRAGDIVPDGYKGFKFPALKLNVTSKSDYPRGSPGNMAVTSGRNAALAVYDPQNRASVALDSYISPVKNFLFDLESVTITVDIDPSDTAAVESVRLYINVIDACGASTAEIITREGDEELFQRKFYSSSFEPNKIQIQFARPYRAISSFEVHAGFDYRSPYYEVVPNAWIDDFKFRKYKGKTPGCLGCGYRGMDWCEVPVIPR